MRYFRRWLSLVVYIVGAAVTILILTKRPRVTIQSATGYESEEQLLSQIGAQDMLELELTDIDQRGRLQKERMEEFCENFIHLRKNRFPSKEKDRLRFMRHIMFNDKHKVIFCFVPKVGSTNLKRLLLYMGDQLPVETVHWSWVDNTAYIEPALKHASFLNYTLTDNDRFHRIRSYYKFMIVRNPLERIVSAYRDKLEAPLTHDASQHNKFPAKMKLKILQKYQPDELNYWNDTHGVRKINITVTFSDYIRYLTDTKWAENQEHFQPQLEACHPCFINFDFYGDFRNISRDVAEMMHKFKTNPAFYKDGSLHSSSEQTSELAREYYGKLTHREKVQLVGAWYDELAFYYTLYPSERRKQYHYLGVNEPIY